MNSTPIRLGPMKETVAGLRAILKDQVNQLHMHAFQIKHKTDEKGDKLKGDPEVYAVIGTMVHMSAVSGISLLKLTDEISVSVKDAFPIARSIVESVVNTCYIMAEGKSEAARAMRHAKFKSLRDLSRDWTAGSISHSSKWGGNLSSELELELETLSKEFMTKKGRDRGWTDKSLRQRLDATSLRFHHQSISLLSSSAFNIYNTASEVVHASYFNSLYFFGMNVPGNRPPKNINDLNLTIYDHQFSVLISAIFSYLTFVECYADYSIQPNLLDETRYIIKILRDLPAIAETLTLG